MTQGFSQLLKPTPRTNSEYDCPDGREYKNLRSLKMGPKGGHWEVTFAKVIGPPMAELRCSMWHCWLCNADLQQHRRQWTRPGWTRNVGWGMPLASGPPPHRGPYDHLSARQKRFLTPRVVFQSTKEEPPSQLDMIICSCPNGCDADDTLQPLLDQQTHTGPMRGPR